MDTPGCPSHLFQALRENAEFRMLFADRVQRHLFNGGALTAENAAARYQSLTDFIDQAVLAESARWGDAVREDPYTRDGEWAAERDAMLYDYFPNRGTILLRQLREAGLYPAVAAPVFYVGGTRQYGGSIAAGEELSIITERTGDSTALAAVETAAIWYTLDGSDPRQPAATEQTALVPRGAEWQYLDDGSDQGSAWRTGPISWPVGPAELGYGDGDERTVVAQGAITTYFRRAFVVDDPSQYNSLVLRLVRDDGVVVYLNGEEIARSNMPDDVPVVYDTPALDAAETEATWFEFPVDSSGLLQRGENVLAAEVHQWSTTSSDVSFDLELLSGSTPGISPSAVEYTTPITLRDTAQVRARVFSDGGWSALTEATFVVTSE